MNLKKYYSLRDLSQELNIPKSTIVKYKDYFPEFFKLYGEGKRKKFQEEALDVLRTVRELREEKKLDWLDIKDALTEKFGEAIETPEPDNDSPSLPAPIPTQSSSISPKQIAHLSHLFNALAFEITRLSSQTAHLQSRQDSQASRLANIEAGLARLSHDVELVLLDTMRRESDSKKFVQQHISEIRTRFDQVRKDMLSLAKGINTLSKNQTSQQMNPDAIRALLDKIDRAAAPAPDSAIQNKYQLLLKENKMLKDRLREIEMPPSREHIPEKPPKKSILGKMFKSQPRD